MFAGLQFSEIGSEKYQMPFKLDFPKDLGDGPLAGTELGNLLITAPGLDAAGLESLGKLLPNYGVRLDHILDGQGIIVGSYISSDRSPLEELKHAQPAIKSIEFTHDKSISGLQRNDCVGAVEVSLSGHP